MKKFFLRRSNKSSPPSPLPSDHQNQKGNFWSNGKKIIFSKQTLLVGLVVVAGMALLSRLPVFSSASNMLRGGNKIDNINLAPLLSGNYATSNNNFAVAIKNLKNALRDPALDADAKNNIYQQLFVLYIKNGNFASANSLLPKIMPIVNADNKPETPSFANLVNLFITIDQIKQKKWEGNILRDDAKGGVSSEHIAVISAWGEASRDREDAALAALDELKKSKGNNDEEVLAQRAMMKLLLKEPLSLSDITAGDEAPKPNQLSLAQSRLYLQSLNMEKKWQEMEDFITNLDHPLPLTLLADEEKIKNKITLPILIEKPEDGLSYFVLDAALNLLSVNPDVALIFCQLALFANPKNFDAAFMLANIDSNVGLVNNSFSILDDLKKNKNYFHMANLTENNLLYGLGDAERAKKNLNNLIRDFPAIVDYSLLLGQINMSEKNYREAERNYAAVLEESKNYKQNDRAWFYYFQYGIALERQSKWALAENNFLIALKLNPDSSETLNYLGYSWIQRHKNIGQALAMLQKANKLSPNNGAILDSLGWAYYQLGKYETARGYLEKAGQLVADDPDINEHLGDVYWRLKQKTTAQLFWQKSLSNVDDDGLRGRLENKIKFGL